MRKIVAGVLLLAAAPAAAQDGWEFTFTPYAWLPGLTNKLHLQRGTVESEASGEDTLSNLDFAFMAALEARHGRWGLVGDLLYVDLSSEADTPLGRLWDSVETDTRGTAFSAYALYRAVETPRIALDVGGGMRAYSFDIKTTLEPGTRPGRSFDLSEDWVDPIIAGRVIATFDERWSANAVLDYGGFDGENDSTWQALASVNYAFNGPIIGVGFRF